jgi:undecaprenyl-diphosphatase
LDERIFHLVYSAYGGALTGVAAVFTVLGEGWVVLALLPLLLVRRLRAPTLSLVWVLVLTAASVWILKLAVHRARPCYALSGVSCLWGQPPTDYSFPSGHAAGSFAFAAFVGAVVFLSEGTGMRTTSRVAVCVVGVTVAMSIALSRVYLGVHFPGDVAAGACLGALIGIVGAKFHVSKVAIRARVVVDAFRRAR